MRNWWRRRQPIDPAAMQRELEALGTEIDRVVALYDELKLAERLKREHGTDLQAIRDEWEWHCQSLALSLETARRAGELDAWSVSEGGRRQERELREAIEGIKARLWTAREQVPGLHRQEFGDRE